MNKEDICAVVTSFRPSESFPDNIQRIISQVGLLVIVDDGDYDDNVWKLKKWFGGLKNLVLHHNQYNSGIAYSLNVGVNIAKDRGYRWALLLDDDSVVPENMTKTLLQALKTASREKPLAIIGADHRLKADAGVNQGKSSIPLSCTTLTRITSGSLISIDAYDKIGRFNEDYFIDYVDIEYCLRANSSGYVVKDVRNIVMIHPVGSELKKGFVTIRSQHNPERQYYFFRNSTDVIVRYWKKFPLFSLSVALNQIKTLVKIIFFQDAKMRRIGLIAKGIRDAHNGRLGKLRTSLDPDK